MPDLDLIKQEEQGVRTGLGRLARGGRAIPPAGRSAAATMSTVLPGCCSPGKATLIRKAVGSAPAGGEP